MGRFDSATAAIFPAWAAKRAHARAEYEKATLSADKLRGFHATSKGRRAGDWVRLGTDKPTESIADLNELRRRSREMRRNNPYFVSAVNTITANVVGHGIRATAVANSKARQQRLQSDWDAWARTKSCDAAGKLDLYAIQSLVMKTVAVAGECLIRRIITRDGKLRLQVLPPEYLATTMDREPAADGSAITGGVETNGYGEATAFYLYRRHPSAGTVSTSDVVRVPAEEICHVFAVDYPGQVRGIPWIAPVFTRLSDLDDFSDAELTRQKIATCFGLFYVGQSPDGEYEVPDKVEPGMSEYLPPGTDVKLITPPPNQSLEVMNRLTLRAVASGIGITYEALTCDYSQVNFSSARMANLAMARNVRGWQQDLMIELFLDKIWRWFCDLRELQGVSGASQATVEWSVPAPQLIDPERETKALRDRVRSGFTPWSDALRELGRDPDQAAQTIAADNKRFDDLQIVVDSDPRKVSMQGQGAVNQKQESSDESAA